MKGILERGSGNRWSLAVCCLLLAVIAVMAQEPAPIGGKVTDAKGVPVPGAMVRLYLGDQTQTAEILTDVDGTFAFPGIPAGVYRLTVEMTGFVKATRDAVDTAAEANRTLTILLQSPPRPPRPPLARNAANRTAVAPQGFQSVEVTDLPGMAQFQQDLGQGADLAGTAPRQDNILLINGNTASLAGGDLGDPGFRQQMMDSARQMGFLLEMNQGPGGRGGEGGFGGQGGDFGGMGGGRGGRGGGPGFIAMAGRGGRGAAFSQPKIQGSVTETFSNSALNARAYSLTGDLRPKPVNIQNNYSMTLGGVLPWFKQSTTNNQRAGRGGGGGGRGGGGRGGGQPGWTFSYSGSRNRSAQDVLTTVPTDLERSGDFSQTFVQVATVDPATGVRSVVSQPVALYHIPGDPNSRFTQVTTIDPVARALLGYIPKANLPCVPGLPCVNNFAYERSLPTTSDQIQANIGGLRLTSRDNLGITYSMRRGSSLSSGLFPGLDSDRTNFAQNIGISGNHTFKSRMAANWRVTLNRTRTEGSNAFAYNQDVEGALGIQGVSREPINWGIPAINFTNYGDLSLAAVSLTRNQTISASGGFSKFGTKHSLQVGGDAAWAQRNTRSDNNARGSFSFTGFSTLGLDPHGRQVPGSGNDFADFLLGLPYSTSRQFVDPAVNPYGSSTYLRNRTFGVYVQDNWRARSNLTLNLGVRYEYFGPTFEKYNRLVSLDVAPGFTAVAQVFPDQVGPLSGQYFPRSLVNPDWNNIGPRIGIAWRPTQNSPFVIRTGYGILYNGSAFSSFVNRLVGQAPFAVSQNLPTDRSNPLTIENGFPVNPSLSILNTFAIDPNYKPGYSQNWNLDIQTQLSRLYVLNVAYTGSKGTGLDILRVPNRTDDAASYIFQSNGASSIYHGLNVGLARRFSRGFNVQGVYTLSKSIDDASGSGGSGVAQNDANLAAERSLSSQDQRHNFQTSFAYELPFGQNRMFFAGASTKLLNFIAGWTVNGNFSMASGSPLTARYTSNNSGSGTALYNALRPDATGVPVELAAGDRTVLRFFDTTAFAIPAGLYGNAGRNTITGPGSIQLNLSVHKNFRLDENNRRIDFSWQVQNLLNHPNWAGVSTTINSLNFGQVTSVGRMRAMTMNLRINF